MTSVQRLVETIAKVSSETHRLFDDVVHVNAQSDNANTTNTGQNIVDQERNPNDGGSGGVCLPAPYLRFKRKEPLAGPSQAALNAYKQHISTIENGFSSYCNQHLLNCAPNQSAVKNLEEPQPRLVPANLNEVLEQLIERAESLLNKKKENKKRDAAERKDGQNTATVTYNNNNSTNNPHQNGNNRDTNRFMELLDEAEQEELHAAVSNLLSASCPSITVNLPLFRVDSYTRTPPEGKNGRTAEVLEKSIHYLYEYLLRAPRQQLSYAYNSSHGFCSELHEFIWDRQRMMRKDWTRQVTMDHKYLHLSPVVPHSFLFRHHRETNAARVKCLESMVRYTVYTAALNTRTVEQCENFLGKKKIFMDALDDCISFLGPYYRYEHRARNAEILSIILFHNIMQIKRKVENASSFITVKDAGPSVPGGKVFEHVMDEFSLQFKEVAPYPEMAHRQEIVSIVRLISAVREREFFKFFDLCRTPASCPLTPLQRAFVVNAFSYVRFRAIVDLILKDRQQRTDHGSNKRVVGMFPLTELSQLLLFDCVDHCRAFIKGMGLEPLIVKSKLRDVPTFDPSFVVTSEEDPSQPLGPDDMIEVLSLNQADVDRHEITADYIYTYIGGADSFVDPETGRRGERSRKFDLMLPPHRSFLNMPAMSPARVLLQHYLIPLIGTKVLSPKVESLLLLRGDPTHENNRALRQVVLDTLVASSSFFEKECLGHYSFEDVTDITYPIDLSLLIDPFLPTFTRATDEGVLLESTDESALLFSSTPRPSFRTVAPQLQEARIRYALWKAACEGSSAGSLLDMFFGDTAQQMKNDGKRKERKSHSNPIYDVDGSDTKGAQGEEGEGEGGIGGCEASIFDCDASDAEDGGERAYHNDGGDGDEEEGFFDGRDSTASSAQCGEDAGATTLLDKLFASVPCDRIPIAGMPRLHVPALKVKTEVEGDGYESDASIQTVGPMPSLLEMQMLETKEDEGEEEGEEKNAEENSMTAGDGEDEVKKKKPHGVEREGKDEDNAFVAAVWCKGLAIPPPPSSSIAGTDPTNATTGSSSGLGLTSSTPPLLSDVMSNSSVMCISKEDAALLQQYNKIVGTALKHLREFGKGEAEPTGVVGEETAAVPEVVVVEEDDDDDNIEPLKLLSPISEVERASLFVSIGPIRPVVVAYPSFAAVGKHSSIKPENSRTTSQQVGFSSTSLVSTTPITTAPPTTPTSSSVGGGGGPIVIGSFAAATKSTTSCTPHTVNATTTAAMSTTPTSAAPTASSSGFGFGFVAARPIVSAGSVAVSTLAASSKPAGFFCATKEEAMALAGKRSAEEEEEEARAIFEQSLTASKDKVKGFFSSTSTPAASNAGFGFSGWGAAQQHLSATTVTGTNPFTTEGVSSFSRQATLNTTAAVGGGTGIAAGFFNSRQSTMASTNEEITAVSAESSANNKGHQPPPPLSWLSLPAACPVNTNAATTTATAAAEEGTRSFTAVAVTPSPLTLGSDGNSQPPILPSTDILLTPSSARGGGANSSEPTKKDDGSGDDYDDDEEDDEEDDYDDDDIRTGEKYYQKWMNEEEDPLQQEDGEDYEEEFGEEDEAFDDEAFEGQSNTPDEDENDSAARTNTRRGGATTESTAVEVISLSSDSSSSCSPPRSPPRPSNNKTSGFTGTASGAPQQSFFTLKSGAPTYGSNSGITSTMNANNSNPSSSSPSSFACAFAAPRPAPPPPSTTTTTVKVVEEVKDGRSEGIPFVPASMAVVESPASTPASFAFTATTSTSTTAAAPALPPLAPAAIGSSVASLGGGIATLFNFGFSSSTSAVNGTAGNALVPLSSSFARATESTSSVATVAAVVMPSAASVTATKPSFVNTSGFGTNGNNTNGATLGFGAFGTQPPVATTPQVGGSSSAAAGFGFLQGKPHLSTTTSSPTVTKDTPPPPPQSASFAFGQGNSNRAAATALSASASTSHTTTATTTSIAMPSAQTKPPQDDGCSNATADPSTRTTHATLLPARRLRRAEEEGVESKEKSFGSAEPSSSTTINRHKQAYDKGKDTEEEEEEDTIESASSCVDWSVCTLRYIADTIALEEAAMAMPAAADDFKNATSYTKANPVSSSPQQAGGLNFFSPQAAPPPQGHLGSRSTTSADILFLANRALSGQLTKLPFSNSSNTTVYSDESSETTQIEEEERAQYPQSKGEQAKRAANEREGPSSSMNNNNNNINATTHSILVSDKERKFGVVDAAAVAATTFDAAGAANKEDVGSAGAKSVAWSTSAAVTGEGIRVNNSAKRVVGQNKTNNTSTNKSRSASRVSSPAGSAHEEDEEDSDTNADNQRVGGGGGDYSLIADSSMLEGLHSFLGEGIKKDLDLRKSSSSPIGSTSSRPFSSEPKVVLANASQQQKQHSAVSVVPSASSQVRVGGVTSPPPIPSLVTNICSLTLPPSLASSSLFSRHRAAMPSSCSSSSYCFSPSRCLSASSVLVLSSVLVPKKPFSVSVGSSAYYSHYDNGAATATAEGLLSSPYPTTLTANLTVFVLGTPLRIDNGGSSDCNGKKRALLLAAGTKRPRESSAEINTGDKKTTLTEKVTCFFSNSRGAAVYTAVNGLPIVPKLSVFNPPSASLISTVCLQEDGLDLSLPSGDDDNSVAWGVSQIRCRRSVALRCSSFLVDAAAAAEATADANFITADGGNDMNFAANISSGVRLAPVGKHYREPRIVSGGEEEEEGFVVGLRPAQPIVVISVVEGLAQLFATAKNGTVGGKGGGDGEESVCDVLMQHEVFAGLKGLFFGMLVDIRRRLDELEEVAPQWRCAEDPLQSSEAPFVKAVLLVVSCPPDSSNPLLKDRLLIDRAAKQVVSKLWEEAVELSGLRKRCLDTPGKVDASWSPSELVQMARPHVTAVLVDAKSHEPLDTLSRSAAPMENSFSNTMIASYRCLLSESAK